MSVRKHEPGRTIRSIGWTVSLHAVAAVFYVQERTPVDDVLRPYHLALIDPAIELLRIVRGGLRQLSTPMAVALAFPFIALALRETAHLVARRRRFRSCLDSDSHALALPHFDGSLFGCQLMTLMPILLFALWYLWRGVLDVASPVACLGYLGIGLAVAYSCALWDRDAMKIYPFSAFPLINAGVALTSYALVVWAGFAWLAPYVARELSVPAPSGIVRLFWYLVWLLVDLGVLLLVLSFVSGGPRHGSRLGWLVVTFLSITAIALGNSWCFFNEHIGTSASLKDIEYWVLVFGVAWSLTVTPFITVAPALILAYERRPARSRTGLEDSRDKERRKASHARLWRWAFGRIFFLPLLDLVRGHQVLLAIMRQHVTTFALSLTLSVGLPLVTVLWWIEQPLNASPLTLANIWFISTAAWLAPFLNGLIFIEETFSKAYSAGLHRALQTIEGHLLVLGYGDLGRRLVETQFTQRDVTYDSLYDHVVMSRNVLMPSGQLGKVLLRVAVVDAAAERLHSVTKTPDQLALGVANVPRAVLQVGDASELLVSYVVPAVVGDATREDVQHLAGFERAAFVCCLTRPDEEHGREPARVVLDRLARLKRHGPGIPAVLALHAARDVSFVTHRTLLDRLPVHHLMPEHIEGLNAAHVLHAACINVKQRRREKSHLQKNEQEKDTWPRILLCGRGKRLYYIIDSFLKELSDAEYDTMWRQQGEREDRPLILLSSDPAFEKFATKQDEGVAPTVAGGLVSGAERGATRFARHIRFNRFVTRNPKVKRSSVPSAADYVLHPEKPFDLAYCRAEFNYDPLRNLLTDCEPDIVLISDYTAADELRLLHSVIVNIKRLRDEKPTYRLPVVLVSGETGQDHLKQNLGDALVYYWSGLPDDDTHDSGLRPFPNPRMLRRTESRRFEGDPLIDVLEAPVERICALIRAYDAYGTGRASRDVVLPVELDFCTIDDQGELAYKFARLAGCEPGPREQDGKLISIRNFRIRERESKHRGFEVRTFASLDDPTKDRRLRLDWCRARVIAGEREAELRSGMPHEAAVTTLMQLLTRSPNEAPGQTVQRSEAESKEHWSHLREQTEQCCGMPTCPVEGIHKIVEATRRTLDPDVVESDEDRTRLRHAVERAFDVSVLPAPPEWPPKKRTGTGESPLAMVVLYCTHTEQPGALATAINALIFQRITLFEELKGAKPDAAPRYIFDFRNVAGYNCHDSRWGVTTCYGHRQRPPANRKLVPLHEILDRVEIRPITQPEAWHDYAKRLARFLNGKGDIILSGLPADDRERVEQQPERWCVPSDSAPDTIIVTRSS